MLYPTELQARTVILAGCSARVNAPQIGVIVPGTDRPPAGTVYGMLGRP